MFLSLNNSIDTDYVNINCILVLDEKSFCMNSYIICMPLGITFTGIIGQKL